MDFNDGEKDLRNAVKNARTAFYDQKGKQKSKRVSRKETRRNKRQEKKVKQHHFMLKKNGKEEPVDNPEDKVDVKKKRKKRKRKNVESEVLTEDTSELTYERMAYEAANKQDEQIISSLGKKLGLNNPKTQSKKLGEDGLDYLLEVCEPLMGGGDLDGEGNDSDEEYLRSKKAKKQKAQYTSKNKDIKAKSNEKSIKEKLLFNDGLAGKQPDEDDIGDTTGDNVIGDLDDDFAELEGIEDDEFSSEDEIHNSEEENEDDLLNESADDENDLAEQEENNLTQSKASSSKYVPPSLRKLQNKEDDEKVKMERLKKQLKGLLNRASESNSQGITNQIEEIYQRNSRNVLNELLYELVCDSCVTEALTPPRLILQLMVIVASLHKTSQCEIGSYFLQMFVEKFNDLHKQDNMEYTLDKKCSNVLYIIITLYNLKIVESLLIYDIVRRLLARFIEQDIELILMVLKACGSDMRKDDPGALKEIILEIQAKSITSEIKEQSRVKFMLDTINALKNNNMRKVPQYDPTLVENARKLLKAITRDRETMNTGTQLKVSLEDLLNAREKGKWWVVGSAWAGRNPNLKKADEMANDNDMSGSQHSEITHASAALLEKARKLRMNTEIRKNIFCVIMSSEDYLDAFEKLQKLNFKEKQGREIIHVVLDCCLQEKTYNPFYAHLTDQFCEHSHSNKITVQYSLWDRFKTLSALPKHTATNMANFLAHMIASKSLTLGVLKVVSFGMLDKRSIRFFSTFFKILLLQHPESSLKSAFKRISGIPKLSLLREGIKIFLRTFLGPAASITTTKSSTDSMKERKLNELIELVESALDGHDYVPL